MDFKKIDYNYELVEEYLELTAKVERSMPSVRLKRIYGFSLEIEDTEKFRPLPEQISIYEEVALVWYKLIEDSDVKKIIWLRSCGMGWKKISKKFNVSRQTASKKYKRGIENLVSDLKSHYFE